MVLWAAISRSVIPRTADFAKEEKTAGLGPGGLKTGKWACNKGIDFLYFELRGNHSNILIRKQFIFSAARSSCTLV